MGCQGSLSAQRKDSVPGGYPSLEQRVWTRTSVQGPLSSSRGRGKRRTTSVNAPVGPDLHAVCSSVGHCEWCSFQWTFAAPMPHIMEETVEMEGEGVPLVKGQKALIAFRTASPFRRHLPDARQGR